MIIQQVSFASGDMFSIAAAMLFNPDLKVAIYLQKQDDDEEPGLQLKKARGVIQFYDEVINDSSRYTIVEATLGKQKPQERAVEIEKAIALKWPQDRDFNHKEDKATELVGTWREEYRKLFRRAMGIKLGSSELLNIQAWLHSRGLTDYHGKRVAVLWSRLSGKKGEIHVEHDTSYYGMFQLCLTALQSNDLVIITGDPPYDPLSKPHRKRRFDDIVTVVNFLHAHDRLVIHPSLREFWVANSDLLGEPPEEKPTFFELAARVQEKAASLPRKAFNLSGFWEGVDGLRDKWCTTRAYQFRLYEYLRRTCSVVKHLGFRSGNLEALALLGYTVRYMEEPFSVGANRMTQWHGTGIGYERIVVSQVPTRSGQHVSRERTRVIDTSHQTFLQKLATLSAEVAHNGRLRAQPIGKLEQALEQLATLVDAGHPQETWTYLLNAYDVLEALKYGLMGAQLPPKVKLPAEARESPYSAELKAFDELLNHGAKGLRCDSVASLIAKAELTKVRISLQYLERQQLGPVMIPKNLKRVNWSPAQLARRQERQKEEQKEEQKQAQPSAKPNVDGLKPGFLTRDLGIIREYLDTAPPNPYFL